MIGVRKAAFANPEYIVLAVLGIVVLAWYHGPGIILSVDSFFVLRPDIALDQAVSAWSQLTSAGVPNFAPQTLVFYALYDALVHLVGLRIAQSAILWSLISTSAISMLVLLKALVTGSTNSARVVVTLVAIFYALNPFTTSYVWWHQTWIELTWATYPFLLALIIKTATNRISPRYAAGAGGLILIAAAPGYTHVLLVPLGALAIGLAAVLTMSSDHAVTTIKRIVPVLAWWGVALAWWILPSLIFLRDVLSGWHAQYQASPAQLLNYGSQFATLWNVLRLDGLLQLHLTFSGQPLYPWFIPFQGGALGVILYAFPACVLLGVGVLLFTDTAPSGRMTGFFFAAAWCGAIFLMKGNQRPFGLINSALLKLPLGAAWQHPYDKFGQVALVSGCVISALGLSSLASNLAKPTRICLVALLFLGVIIEGWPAYAGTVLTPQLPPIPSSVAVVPVYYDDFRTGYGETHGFILQLPLRENGETAFDWARGSQTNNDPVLENYDGGSPVIRMRTGYLYADNLLDEAKNALLNRVEAERVLSNLGFSGVVIHRDWNEAFFPMGAAGVAELEEHLIGRRPSAGGAVLTAGRKSVGLRLPLSYFDSGDFEFSAYIKIHDPKKQQTIFDTGTGLQLMWLPQRYLGLWGYGGKSAGKWLPTEPLALGKDTWFKVDVEVSNQTAVIRVNDATYARGHFSGRTYLTTAFAGSADNSNSFTGSLADVSLASGGTTYFASQYDPVLLRRGKYSKWEISGRLGGEASAEANVVDVSPKKNVPLAIPLRVDWSNTDINMEVRAADYKTAAVLLRDDSGSSLSWLQPGYIGLYLASPIRGQRGAWLYSPVLNIRNGSWLRIHISSHAGVAAIFVNGTMVASGSAPRTKAVAPLYLGGEPGGRNLEDIAGFKVRQGDRPYVSILGNGNSARTYSGWHYKRTPEISGFSLHRYGELDYLATRCPAPPVFLADSLYYSSALMRTGALPQPLAPCSQRIVTLPAAAPRVAVNRNVRISKSAKADVTGYDLSLTGSGNALLVMNTSFAPEWVAIPAQPRVKVLGHLVANGFANAYLVHVDGRGVLRVRYVRQRLVWGALISGLIIAVASLCLVAAMRLRLPNKDSEPLKEALSGIKTASSAAQQRG